MSVKRLAVVMADTGLLEREIADFVRRKARAGERKPLSVSAFNQYKNNLRLFVEWCAVQTPPITSTADTGPDTIRAYDGYLANRTKISQKSGQPTGERLSIASQRTYLRPVRAFLRASNVERDKEWRLPPEPRRGDEEFAEKRVLSDDEVEALIRSAGSNRRNALIVETLATTGMRVGELLRLRGRDILEDKHTHKGVIRIPGGKTGGRLIGAVPSVWRKLRKWADANGGDDEFLFMGSRRRPRGEENGGEYIPLKVSGVEQMIRHLARDAKLGDGISPHTFRHTLATRMVKAKANLVVLQNQLGHRDLTQISRTYGHVQPETMTDALIEVFGR